MIIEACTHFKPVCIEPADSRQTIKRDGPHRHKSRWKEYQQSITTTEIGNYYHVTNQSKNGIVQYIVSYLYIFGWTKTNSFFSFSSSIFPL